MARTGRFGRLPTQAPDLSSQIVSLMEQWMNAEDRNILDAWTNGGKYKGKKVTDRAITDHYRKRRNGYDRDDPEWDEWDQDLWQIRYQIADEKVQMQYRMGKIGPSAVAAHYRQWARKMPVNSSYYRNLMATAGDFAKAAAAGKSASEKGFDYQAMQDRINALERREKPITDFFAAINEYAVARGFIPRGSDLMDPNNLNAFESHDLQAILDGVTSHPDHKSALIAAQNASGYDGPLTVRKVNAMVDNFVGIQKQKIGEWRKAPYDMSSYIKGARDSIRDARSYSRLVKNQLDIGADLAEAWDIWTGQSSDRVADNDPRRTLPGGGREEGIQGAIDPEDSLSGDANFVAALKKGRNGYARTGNTEQVAALNSIIKAFSGDDAAIREVLELDPTVTTGIFGQFSPFADPGAIGGFAQERKVLKQATPLLQSGQAVIYYNPDQPSPEESALGAAGKTPFVIYTAEENASGRTILKDPNSDFQMVLDDSAIIVSTLGSNGTLNPTLINGKPVYGVDGPSGAPIGYEYNIRGSHTIYGRPNETNPGQWDYLAYAPWTQSTGVSLDDRGEYVQLTVAGQDPNAEPAELDIPIIENLSEVVQTAVDRIEQSEGLTDEEKIERSDAVRTFADDIEAGNFEGILNDPTKLQAYSDAYIAEVGPSAGYSDTPEMEAAAQLAFARESMRRTHGADIPYTREDAVFITPGGQMRDQMNAGIYFNDPNLPQPEQDAALRGSEMAKVEGGDTMSYGERLQAAGIVGGMGDMAFDPSAFAGTGAIPDTFNTMPTDVLKDDPNVATNIANGNTVEAITQMTDVLWDSAVPNPNLASWMADPEKQRISAKQMDSFNQQSLMNYSSTDTANQTLYAQSMAAAQTVGKYAPMMTKVLEGGSEAAVAAGAMLGMGSDYATQQERVAKNLNDAFGIEVAAGLEPIAPPAPSFVGPRPVGDAVSRGTADIPRLDLMLPTARPPKESAVKPPPTMKVAANLLQYTSPGVIPNKAMTVPMPPGVQGPAAPYTPPAPPPPPSIASAVKSLKPPAPPPPPPTIESAMKSLIR